MKIHFIVLHCSGHYEIISHKTATTEHEIVAGRVAKHMWRQTSHTNTDYYAIVADKMNSQFGHARSGKMHF